jgi:hypothetical protein
VGERVSANDRTAETLPERIGQKPEMPQDPWYSEKRP